MSERIGDVAVIYEEDDRRCETCGVLAETRPYGPPDATGRYVRVCFTCAMDDEAGTTRRMSEVLFGDPVSDG